MTPSIGKKLSLFVGTMVLLVAGSVGFVSYRLMESHFAQMLRNDTLDTTTLLASRVNNEMRHIAEKGRILAAAALEEFKNPEDQFRFLQENLTIDEQFIAMTLFRRSPASNQKWIPLFKLTRPESDPFHLTDEDFKDLDLKYPLEFGLVAQGSVEITFGNLQDGSPILRMAVPIVKKRGSGFTQLLEIEVKQEKITAAFAEATAHFSFILDRSGRVLAQTDPTHFTLGEDLSHLPILEMARATEAPNGNLDYYELPGGSLQYGSYHKIGFADLTVVSQAPRSMVVTTLRNYTRQTFFLAAACALIAMALTMLASWGIVGARLRKLAATFGRVGSGSFAVRFQDTRSEDEVGDFARTLQAVCDELDSREKVHGTFAKFKNRRVKAKMEEGKINLRGERVKAFVLHCHLNGLEEIIKLAEPEFLVAQMNHFNENISTAIEKSGGIVDHIHGGSVVAYWGVPVATRNDCDRALSTCLQVREITRELNERLTKHKLPAVTLSMGMHHGVVVAGQIGTADRMEYTALGEALEVSSRIQSFTDQFGTDFLMTGTAAREAPEWYQTEQVSSGDENIPELFELVGVSAERKAASDAQAETAEDEAVKKAA